MKALSRALALRLLLALAAQLVTGDDQTASSARVKDNTVYFHTQRRAAISFFNSSAPGSVVSAVENATAPLVASIASNTAISPAPADKPASKAAVPPSAFALIGDGSLFGGDSSWAYGDSKYAIPATIVLVLVLFAGVGLFIVYWRRKRASNYYGLKEAELNSVQMHRS